jgi:glycosyltransferase involved in cell wall biosynthesis
VTTALQHPLGFKSPYVWPNPAFPFRVYYEGPNCRIFIIENIQHNWNWLLEWHEHIRETDYFFVYCGWYFDDHFATISDKIFEVLNLRKDNFFFMFNSNHEMDNFTQYGFKGDVINHNAWIDENQVMKSLPNTPKIYDAVYVARRSAFKRHMLAESIQKLALIAGNNHGKDISDVPNNPAFINDTPLKPAEVCEKINQSHVGLILSASEGACFSSSEYLLCGIPVVSTPSFGGRDVWYNEYNSIICEPNADAVADAVERLKRRDIDPMVIRQMHIDMAQVHRQRFINQLQHVFNRFSTVSIDATSYFNKNFMHKMRKSYTPDFETLFGSNS